MNGSIRLHPQHGVNPTLPVCFWCGKETGEVALLGAAYKEQAPMHMVLNVEPCEKCRANMALGITIAEAHRRPHPNCAQEGDVWLTGRWIVLKEEAFRRIIQPGPLLDDVLKKRRCNVEPAVFEIFQPKEQAG